MMPKQLVTHAKKNIDLIKPNASREKVETLWFNFFSYWRRRKVNLIKGCLYEEEDWWGRDYYLSN